ncbi:MAG: thioredoxin [Candidatus Bipolaricaulia bacterium]
MKPVAVNDSNFESEVLQTQVPVLVDFWAEWCGPCHALAPIVEEIASDYGDQLKVVKLNVDENQQTAIQYGIMSIPTLLLFKDGEIIEKLIGYMPKGNLIRRLAPHVSLAGTATEV